MNGKEAASQDIISGLLLSIDYVKRLFSTTVILSLFHVPGIEKAIKI